MNRTDGRLTLESLARARGLSPALLRELGWVEQADGVAIPWRRADGRTAWHVRHTLEKEDGRRRWSWEKYDREQLLPYRSQDIQAWRQQGYTLVVVTEGEIDAVALTTAGVPAIAAGGAEGWQGRWWELLAGFERVVVWLEDAGSVSLLRATLQTWPPGGPTVLVAHNLGGQKDPGRILAAHNGDGRALLRRRIEAATPVEAVPDLLEAVVRRLGAERRPNGSCAARCPFHEDRHPSLSIFRGDDGTFAFRCHSGRCGVAGPLALLGAALGLVEGSPPSLPTIDPSVGSEVVDHTAPAGGREAGRALPTSLPTIDPSVGSEVVDNNKPLLRTYTADEILAASPAPDALPSLPLLGRNGYIIKGWSHLLAAPPKCGKTELLFACVQEWCRAGTTVHWLSEEALAVWAVRLRRTGSLPNLQVTPALGARPGDLLAHARATEAEVVIVDTIRNLLRVDELDNTAIAGVLGEWVTALQGRTVIFVHHSRKGGGEHGEAIAGGFAFLGVVDRALEIRYDAHDRRRLLVGESRLLPVEPLVYELDADDRLRALGNPQAVELQDLKERLLSVLTFEWQKTSDLHQALAEPRPSLEQVRRALLDLARDGHVERTPPLDNPAQGRTVLWRLRAPTEDPRGDGRLSSSTSLPTENSIVGSEVGSSRPPAGGPPATSLPTENSIVGSEVGSPRPPAEGPAGALSSSTSLPTENSIVGSEVGSPLPPSLLEYFAEVGIKHVFWSDPCTCGSTDPPVPAGGEWVCPGCFGQRDPPGG